MVEREIGAATMLDLLQTHPWLIVLFLIAAVVIACVAIVFVTDYNRRTHQAEIDAMLKRDMLARGLSAADIKTVLEASGDPEHARAACENGGVRLGLGKLQVEMGSFPQPPGSWKAPEASKG
jgi:hypothetical protein